MAAPRLRGSSSIKLRTVNLHNVQAFFTTTLICGRPGSYQLGPPAAMCSDGLSTVGSNECEGLTFPPGRKTRPAAKWMHPRYLRAGPNQTRSGSPADHPA